jgi:hypothetical protein
MRAFLMKTKGSAMVQGEARPLLGLPAGI